MNLGNKFALTAVFNSVAALAITAGTAGVSNAVAADTTFPTISITGGGWRTVNKSHSLTGLTGDNVAVMSVRWSNARTGAMGAASLSGQSKSASWAIENIAVLPGDNVIAVAAFDAAGNKTRIQTTVTAASGTPPHRHPRQHQHQRPQPD